MNGNHKIKAKHKSSKKSEVIAKNDGIIYDINVCKKLASYVN